MRVLPSSVMPRRQRAATPATSSRHLSCCQRTPTAFGLSRTQWAQAHSRARTSSALVPSSVSTLSVSRCAMRTTSSALSPPIPRLRSASSTRRRLSPMLTAARSRLRKQIHRTIYHPNVLVPITLQVYPLNNACLLYVSYLK